MQYKAYFYMFLALFGLSFTTPSFAFNSNVEMALRAQEIADLKLSDMIIYSPKETSKGVVLVFTDLDCGYCKKLHRELNNLMALGIEVRYLAYPRNGTNSRGYNKIVSVWCTADRKGMLARAMEGKAVPQKVCNNAVATQYTLGRKWGVMGTPTLVFLDGAVWQGYLSAEQMAREAIRHTPQ